MIVNKELANSVGHELKDLWGTPPKIYDPLNAEFGFTLDPCCVPETAKCAKYYTPIEDGLKQDWSGETAYCNPPYSRGNIDKWVHKCYIESQKPGTMVVALLPVSTSCDWFHDWVWHKGIIRYVKRRIRFVNAPSTAPFSSMIVIYNPPQ